MRKGVALLLTLTATAFVAATAQAGHRAAAAQTAGISCKSTMKIAFVTPLTGGAGFLGQEQSSWAKYAVKTLGVEPDVLRSRACAHLPVRDPDVADEGLAVGGHAGIPACRPR